jgi:hypothetical protein
MKIMTTALTFGLLTACVSTKSDDTAEPSSEPSDAEPDAGEPDEPVAPPSGLTPDAVYFDVRAVVQNNTIGTAIASDGSEFSGQLVIFIADSANWEGTDDVDNACALIFNMTPDSATYDPSFESAGAWLGFSFSALDNYVGESPSCADMDEDYAPLITRWSTAGFGVGIGPMNPDDSASLQDAVADAAAQGSDVGDWETDWAPYLTQAYVMIDGLDIDEDGVADPYFVNFTRSYQVNEDGTLATADEDGNADPAGQYLLKQSVVDEDGNALTYAIDGYYAGFPWAGLNADFFLQ